MGLGHHRIPYHGRQAFLCVVKDLYDGMIVGWSIARRAPRHLVLRAMAMAKAQRGTIAGEFIFHLDHGKQYTSADNAAAESFLVS